MVFKFKQKITIGAFLIILVSQNERDITLIKYCPANTLHNIKKDRPNPLLKLIDNTIIIIIILYTKNIFIIELASAYICIQHLSYRISVP